MPFMEIHPTKPDRVVLHTDYVDRHLVKEVPGTRFDRNLGAWVVPRSWNACITARALFGPRLQVGPLLTAWSWSEFRGRIQPAMHARMRLTPEHTDHDLDLHPFQRAGVEYLALAHSALLADPMGSGKTVQIIRALRRAHTDTPVFPALVIAPNSLKLNWAAEITRWWPGPSIQVIDGSAAQRRKQLAEGPADFTVINYEALRLHSRLAPYGSIRLKHCVVCEPELDDTPANQQGRCERCPRELNAPQWGAVVLDEAHRIKDPASKQTRAVLAIAHTSPASRRLAATGTPIADNSGNLWAILHFLSELEHPTHSRYLDRYCERFFNPHGGLEVLGLRPDTRAEFHQMLEPRLRRLPLEVILPDLPPLIHTERPVLLHPKQRRVYDQMRKQMIVTINGLLHTTTFPLVQVTRLMQLASAYATLHEQPSTPEHPNGYTTITLAEPSNKIDALVDLIDEIGPDEPLVVFAASKQLINLAAQRLTRLKISHALVTGDQNAHQQQTAIQDFQAGRFQVFLGTIQAAGEGITLTRARMLVFLNRHWSAVLNEQAERRVYRIGSEQHTSVEIITFTSPDTVEARQDEVLATKLGRLEEVVRDRDALLALLGSDVPP